MDSDLILSLLMQMFSTVTTLSGILLHMLGVGLTLEEAESLQAKVMESQLALEEVMRETKGMADEVRGGDRGWGEGRG